jgi:rubrerythrin
MAEEIDKSKIRHLLGHWIEHNQSHCESFEQWAGKLKEAGYPEVAEEIMQASGKMEEASALLEKVRDSL